MTPQEFLPAAVSAAIDGKHLWPHYAACEAALESAWGSSELAQRANNLFGQKWPRLLPPGWNYVSITLPTHEYEHGQIVPATAQWPVFPSWTVSFQERMVLLRRLQGIVSNYGCALRAATGEEFVTLVSRSWATDPERARKVLEIYGAHQSLLDSLPTEG